MALEGAQPEDKQATAAMVNAARGGVREIDAFLEEWQELVSGWGPDNLFYGEKFMFNYPESTQRRLLKVFNSDKNDLSARDPMTSMRNVDSTVAGNVLIWEE